MVASALQFSHHFTSTITPTFMLQKTCMHIHTFRFSICAHTALTGKKKKSLTGLPQLLVGVVF